MTEARIRLDAETRDKIAALKASSGESYDDVLNRLLALVPEGDDEGAYTDEFRAGLLAAQVEALTGDTIDHDSVKQALGL